VISDEDRQRAYETFGLIERSEHVQADQPAVTPEPDYEDYLAPCNKTCPHETAPPGHRNSDVSLALAEHTAPALDAIERAATTSEMSDKRRGIIQGLRDMADALQAHPELPTPYDITVSIFWQIGDDGRLGEHVRQEHARAAMAALPGGWEKQADGGDFISYIRAFGPDVAYQINADRAEVCRRVQVGTRNVPAHDEPVYKWECGPEATEICLLTGEIEAGQ